MCIEWILGSIALHSSTMFEPEEGYNYLTNSVGIEASDCAKEGISHSLTGFRFDDSYGKTSKYAGYSIKYKNEYLTPALGVGYVKTSYYEGFIPIPHVEKAIGITTVQLMYYPETTTNDGVLALQLKWRF